MKKFVSLLLSLTLMLLCCGCSGGTDSSKGNDYLNEPVRLSGLAMRHGVVSTRDIDSSNTTKGVFTYKDSEINGSSTLYVTYKFKNTADYTRCINDVLVWGEMEAYQGGVKLTGHNASDGVDQSTEVLGGAEVEITKYYELNNLDDPVTIIVKDDYLLISANTYVNKELTLGTIIEENMIDSSPYDVSVYRSEDMSDGNIKIFCSFTNNSDSAVAPGSVVGIQAFQGNERLNPGIESMTDDTHYLKYYYVQPGEKADFYVSFKLANDKDKVTAYITRPSDAYIYHKASFSMK